MATLNTTRPTLLDYTQSLGPDGGIMDFAEILAETNEIVEDAVMLEGNLPTGHKYLMQTGIPDPTWRKIYGGVQPVKGTQTPVTDSCAMMENYAEVDKALADLNGNTLAFRAQQERHVIGGMSKDYASKLFYGNDSTTPEHMLGLAPRYNDLSAENADNIIDGGGTGSDNTSIWLVVWGDQTCHGIFPKGSTAGLQVMDKGQVTIESIDGNGGRMEAYRTHFKWDCGLAVPNWKYVVRIANIDVSDLDTLANTKNLLTWMVQASERIDNFSMGKACWYVNRTIREKLRLGILEKVASNLTWETVEGKRVMNFDDVPVRRCDALLNTEAQIT